MKKIFLIGILAVAEIACSAQEKAKKEKSKTTMDVKLNKEVLKDKLTPEQYYVCVEKGTERAFTGKYWNHKGKGIYKCVVCNEPLFSSSTKYDSGSGWPSFYDALDKSKIKQVVDNSYGMKRIEIRCANCDSHLGHVFPDGPKPTGIRYCVNSASLDFEERAP
jgi:peptide-methionine (R)-S-oxide reductase